jgi:hypothetical protein
VLTTWRGFENGRTSRVSFGTRRWKSEVGEAQAWSDVWTTWFIFCRALVWSWRRLAVDIAPLTSGGRFYLFPRSRLQAAISRPRHFLSVAARTFVS